MDNLDNSSMEELLLDDGTDFTDTSINQLSDQDKYSMMNWNKKDLPLEDIHRTYKRIPSLDEPIASTSAFLQFDNNVEQSFVGLPNADGSNDKIASGHHNLDEFSNSNSLSDLLSKHKDDSSVDPAEDVSEDETETEVVSRTQESSEINFEQDTNSVIALLGGGVKQHNNDDEGEEGALDKSSKTAVQQPSLTPRKIKGSRKPRTRRQQSGSPSTRASQSCCVSLVINPDTNGNFREEPIHVGSNIFIPRDKWAAAFSEDDIGGCARHIFKEIFTPQEIESCTYSGKNNTQKLCRKRIEVIFDIVAWMRSNKKEYPYPRPINPFPENINIQSSGKLSETEKSIIIKKVFVEDRSQQRMKLDHQRQKVDELEGKEVPSKAKKCRKS